MSVTVRRAGSGDCAALSLVGAATFLETFTGVLDGGDIVSHCARAHSPGWYAEALDQGAAAWLAELAPGDAPVGFALLGAADLPGMAADGSDLELKRIYALSRYHGQGVGRALMDHAEREARARQASRMLLGVYAGNARALAFYAGCGFKLIAERQFVVGGKLYPDVVLAKPLLNGAAPMVVGLAETVGRTAPINGLPKD